MKVGDMVIRAYAWHDIIPGIIVEIEKNMVEFDDGAGGSCAYEEINYIVAWSDGMQSSELDVELDCWEQYANESRRFSKGS